MGGRVVNVFTRRVEEVSVAVTGGRVSGFGPGPFGARETIDLSGRFLSPGFIDAHMHVESTMMMPREFVRVAAPHGTTGVVFDPHEIANVLGVPGIRLLMDASVGLPMNIFFGASSCVPSSGFETSGERLEAADLEPLFDDQRVVALAEMMNFPGVVNADPAVLAKVRLGLDRAVVDGHCPGLSGPALGAYAGAGIGSDHECTNAEEALERVRLGMRVFVREGSAARNLEALVRAIDDRNAGRFCFCTDDRHPGDLQGEGHIDHAVRSAVRLGLDPVTAIAMASLHTAEHYRLPDLGAVAPGRRADLIVFEDLADITPAIVFFGGELIAENGVMKPGVLSEASGPDDAFSRDSVKLPAGFGAGSFAVQSPGTREIRVIEADPHQIWTGQTRAAPKIERGLCVADPARDLLKLAVVARHGRSGNVGLGFVTGFGFSGGALASTVGHDAHNLTVVGDGDGDMALAATALAGAGGGQCVVRGGEVLALLPLPIAGLISDEPAGVVIARQRALLDAARRLGCPLHDPFMPLSFLPLPVIPELKLTDLGLIDVLGQRVVPLGID